MLRFTILQTVGDKVVFERSQEEILTRLVHGVEEYLAGKDEVKKSEVLASVGKAFNDIVLEIKKETIRL